MIPSLNSTNSTTPPLAAGTATATSGTDALANEQTFLKLFVAQLKNQDPLQPQDGTQFVAQLAQFSSLEQQLQIRQDLDSINKILSTPNSTQNQNNSTQATGQ